MVLSCVFFISCCRFLHSREFLYSNPQHFYLNMERKTYTSGNYYPGKSAHVLVWLAESSLRISNIVFFVWLHDYRKAEMLCKVEQRTEHSDLQISNFISNLFTIECRKHQIFKSRSCPKYLVLKLMAVTHLQIIGTGRLFPLCDILIFYQQSVNV